MDFVSMKYFMNSCLYSFLMNTALSIKIMVKKQKSRQIYKTAKIISITISTISI